MNNKQIHHNCTVDYEKFIIVALWDVPIKIQAVICARVRRQRLADRVAFGVKMEEWKREKKIYPRNSFCIPNTKYVGSLRTTNRRLGLESIKIPPHFSELPIQSVTRNSCVNSFEIKFFIFCTPNNTFSLSTCLWSIRSKIYSKICFHHFNYD